jgi:hypothetical protein
MGQSGLEHSFSGAVVTPTATTDMGLEERVDMGMDMGVDDMGLEEQVARGPRVAEAVQRLRADDVSTSAAAAANDDDEQVLGSKAQRAAAAGGRAAAAALGRVDDWDSSSGSVEGVAGGSRGRWVGFVGAVVNRVAGGLGFHW